MNANSTATEPVADRGDPARIARVRYAQALAGIVLLSDEAPSLVEALEDIETTMPNASDVDVFRQTFIEVAEVIAGGDEERWHLLLLRLLAEDGHLLLQAGE